MTFLDVELRKKSESWLMRAIALLLRLLPGAPSDFMSGWWTTLGTTVYVPTAHDTDPLWGTERWRRSFQRVLSHEAVHAAQFERWGWTGMALGYLGPSVVLGLPALLVCGVVWAATGSWMPFAVAGGLSLALLPLSVGLAWGRWRIEREAYAAEFRFFHDPDRRDWVRRVGRRIGRASDHLWRSYVFTWPPAWMEEWFWAEAERQRAVRMGAKRGARL